MYRAGFLLIHVLAQDILSLFLCHPHLLLQGPRRWANSRSHVFWHRLLSHEVGGGFGSVEVGIGVGDVALWTVSGLLLFLILVGRVPFLGILSLLTEVIKYVLLFLGDVGKKVFGVTVIHLVFVECGYFDFVWIFPVLFLFVVHLLLKLYPDWFGMRERFWIKFFILLLLIFRGISLTVVSKMETVLVTLGSSLIGAKGLSFCFWCILSTA